MEPVELQRLVEQLSLLVAAFRLEALRLRLGRPAKMAQGGAHAHCEWIWGVDGGARDLRSTLCTRVTCGGHASSAQRAATLSVRAMSSVRGLIVNGLGPSG